MQEQTPGASEAPILSRWELAGRIDYALLTGATRDGVTRLCGQAVDCGVAYVCVPAEFVEAVQVVKRRLGLRTSIDVRAILETGAFPADGFKVLRGGSVEHYSFERAMPSSAML